MRLILHCFSIIQMMAFCIQSSYQFQSKQLLLDRSKQSMATTTSATDNYFRLRMGFFDKIKEAFQNDSNDCDAIVGDDDDLSSKRRIQRTPVQQQWIDSAGGKKMNTPIPSALLEGTKWSLELFLAGLPDRDPGSDLYGSRINISARDSKLGLGMSCPDEASIIVTIEFDKDGVCKAQKSSYTTGVNGLYKVQDNGNMIRFSVDTSGYTRTVQTTGTITRVFWSDGGEVTSRTSSTYSIPLGYIYADCMVRYGRIPGTFEMDDGILRVEQTSGLFGVSSKMVVCGKFRAFMLETGEVVS